MGSSVTGTKSITLNNTADTDYAGTLPEVNSVTKTGAYKVNLQQGISGSNLKVTIQEGTLSLGVKDASTMPTISGDVTLDGGTLATSNASDKGNGKIATNVYVTANGGTLAINSTRGYINNGIQSASGADTSNATLKFNGRRFFVNGTSTFKGYFELIGGYTHFTQEALNSTKGLILNGGVLQYSGEIPGGSGTKDLSAPIYIKGNSAIQCGWSASFNLNGSITDWEGSDLTGQNLNIYTDSGYVVFNGEINTKAMLTLYDNAKIGGANDVTFGGLNGSNTGKGLTLVSATTAKNLTLNVAVSTAPSFSSQLTGAFNLVKEGAGTQTFATAGIGSATAPLNSITINEGSVKMTGNAPIYTNSLTVNADGKLEFGTGTYNIQTGTLDGTGEISLAFTSDTDYTVLDFSGSTFSEVSPALVSLNQSTYTLEQFKTYTIATNVPATMETDFNYKSLLKGSDAYYFDLNRVGNSLVLQMDNNAVPEPATWLMFLIGIVFWKLRFDGRW